MFAETRNMLISLAQFLHGQTVKELFDAGIQSSGDQFYFASRESGIDLNGGQVHTEHY